MNRIGGFFRGILNRILGRTQASLVELVGQIAETARSNASWSSTIPGAIEVGDAVQGDTWAAVSIILNLDEAPEAAAFEWGSGERATRGPQEDYPITPKTANALAFLWEYPSPLGRKYLVEEDENVIFQKVMHPGVEARPYLQPAIDQYAARLRQKLAQDVSIELVNTIQEEFRDMTITINL